MTGPLRPGLLHDMGQLMGDQPPSFVRARRELACGEHDVVSYGVGLRVHVLGRLLGSRAGMHPDPGKVGTEPLLHVLP